MSAANPKSRSNTAEQILDLAESLIQSRGYNSFSYQDISEALGVTKASIHYHFAAKADLGIAVVDRYVERFAAALEDISRDQTRTSLELLDFYAQPFLKLAETPDKVCLSGALAGEMLALPPEMRLRIDRFFRDHHAWLTGIFERGTARGDIVLAATPAETARLVFGALQGALLVKRTTGDASQLQDVVKVLKAQLTVTPTHH
jgi:TetR/AcrR family transcriptional regulator, transcriptional repressor for nem operon